MKKKFIWNPSNCECECDKSCGIEEYLNYKNCMCRKNIVDKLVEECTKIVDYDETLSEIPLNDSSSDCIYCTSYIVLFSVFLITSVIIDGGVFVYFYWYSKKEDNISTVKFNPGNPTKIYYTYKMKTLRQINIKSRPRYFIIA